MARYGEVVRQVGKRGYYGLDVLRGLGEGRTWGSELLRQMYAIGVGSIPLVVVVVAAFLGGVTAMHVGTRSR